MAESREELLYAGGAMWFLAIGTWFFNLTWIASAFFFIVGIGLIAHGLTLAESLELD